MTRNANPVRVEGDTAFLSIACRKRGFHAETLVSLCDLPRVSSVRWCAWWNARMGGYYVMGKHNGKNVYLHRFLTHAKDGQDVDHRNHQTLDNRQGNLRVCSRSVNMSNRTASKTSKSGLRGVSMHSQTNKWCGDVTVNGKRFRLYPFDTAEDAHTACKAVRFEHLGYEEVDRARE